MFRHALLLKLAVVLVAACGAFACAGEEGASLTLRAKLVEKDGTLSFITPTATVLTHAKADLVGKPYYVATFHAGFSPGNDPAIDEHWGTVPEDLAIGFSPTGYADGAYDAVLVIYVHTTITDAMKNGEESPPAAVGGDIATFTISQADVREGDAEIIPGVVRFNVEGGDAMVEVENKIPADLMDSAQITAAMTNTLMFVP